MTSPSWETGQVDPVAALAPSLAGHLVEGRFHRAPWICYRTAQARMRGMGTWRPHALGALARVEFGVEGFDTAPGGGPTGRACLASLADWAGVEVEVLVYGLEDLAAAGGWLAWDGAADTLRLIGQGLGPWDTQAGPTPWWGPSRATGRRHQLPGTRRPIPGVRARRSP